MSAIRVAITGADGTGKTTLIKEIQRRVQKGIHAFHAPNYHEDQSIPFLNLSRTIDHLNNLSNDRADGPMKAVSLFLGMTLFGEMERYSMPHFKPRILVSEHNRLVDSFAFARFYKRLLYRGI